MRTKLTERTRARQSQGGREALRLAASIPELGDGDSDADALCICPCVASSGCAPGKGADAGDPKRTGGKKAGGVMR